MTNDEKKLIMECRIMIVGKGEFITYIKEELRKLAFCKIAEIGEIFNGQNKGILIEYAGAGLSQSSDMNSIICDLLGIRHHKGVFNKIENCHNQSFRGGKIIFLALSNMVDRTLR